MWVSQTMHCVIGVFIDGLAPPAGHADEFTSESCAVGLQATHSEFVGQMLPDLGVWAAAAASEDDGCCVENYAAALHADALRYEWCDRLAGGFIEQRRGARGRKSCSRVARHALR